VQLGGWQRALLSEGAVAVAVVLVLADLASAWLLLALPLAVALVVKSHDVVAGQLRGQQAAAQRQVPVAGRPGGPAQTGWSRERRHGRRQR